MQGLILKYKIYYKKDIFIDGDFEFDEWRNAKKKDMKAFMQQMKKKILIDFFEDQFVDKPWMVQDIIKNDFFKYAIKNKCGLVHFINKYFEIEYELN